MNVSLVPDAHVPMNVGEFLAWSELHPEPEDQRYELVDGEIVAISRLETIEHCAAKGVAGFALHDAVRAAGLPCVVLLKGSGIAINDDTVRLPDVVVQRSRQTDLDAMLIEDPLIVVEVASHASNPLASKFIEYFSVDSIHHYLISVLKKRAVIHHRRNERGTFDTRIVKDGDIVLDPPGLSVSVAAFLGEEDY
jgi:Uma2 family endonuclease